MSYFTNIDAERVRLKMSRSEMAKELRMSLNSLSNKINKRHPFTADEILTLARLTGKPMEYLLEPDSKKPAQESA